MMVTSLEPCRRDVHTALLPSPGSGRVEWRIEPGLTDYRRRGRDDGGGASPRSGDGSAGELVWLVEHPPLYTAGTSAKSADLVDPDRFPVFAAGRGGEYTYHGPGQRVAYVMLDLKRRREDVRAFVAALEEWIIRSLAAFNVRGERREDRVGVWVVGPTVRGCRTDAGRGQDRRDRHSSAALGVASTASPSTSNRTSSISPASCRAALPTAASPAWSTSACP